MIRRSARSIKSCWVAGTGGMPRVSRPCSPKTATSSASTAARTMGEPRSNPLFPRSLSAIRRPLTWQRSGACASDGRGRHPQRGRRHGAAREVGPQSCGQRGADPGGRSARLPVAHRRLSKYPCRLSRPAGVEREADGGVAAGASA